MLRDDSPAMREQSRSVCVVVPSLTDAGGDRITAQARGRASGLGRVHILLCGTAEPTVIAELAAQVERYPLTKDAAWWMKIYRGEIEAAYGRALLGDGEVEKGRPGRCSGCPASDRHSPGQAGNPVGETACGRSRGSSAGACVDRHEGFRVTSSAGRSSEKLPSPVPPSAANGSRWQATRSDVPGARRRRKHCQWGRTPRPTRGDNPSCNS